MPVGVVRSDADQSNRRRSLPVRQRVLVGRPVVRHLDDVDRFESAAAEPPLRRLPQVPEEQAGKTRRAVRTGRRPEHEAGVVAVFARAGSGPDDLPAERPERPRGAVVRPTDVDTGVLQRPHDTCVSRSADRSDEGGLHPVGHGVHRADVVAVEVRQDEQVDAFDAEQVEACAEPLTVVAGVHQGDSRPRRPAHEHGVTLADVARRHGPVRRQTGTHDDPRHGDDHHADHEDGAGQQQETETDPARHEHRDGEAHADDRGSDDAADAGRPRCRGVGQRSRAVGDAADRTGGDPGDRGEHIPAPGPDGRGEAGREPHDGDDRCERFGEQVRRHRVRRECRRQRDRHRPARHLRGHGDRQCSGERGPQPPGEQPGQRRTEHDDPRRGEHGQGEPERAREPGVDHEHADHGQGYQRHSAHRTPGQVDDQNNDGHHRRPDDRRVRSDEHDEREQERHGDGRTNVARKPDHAPHHHHQSDDHRAVRA